MSHVDEVRELLKNDKEDVLFRKIANEAAQLALLLHGQAITETVIRRLMDAGSAIALEHVNAENRASREFVERLG